MKKVSSILWGIVLVAVGLIFALNAFNVTDIDLFFDGWWTLFIIVPCTVGLFTEREKSGNIFGIVIGVLLLLACQDILDFSMVWKLMIPVVIVFVGLKLVLSGIFGNKANEIMKKAKTDGKDVKNGCAVFSGCDVFFFYAFSEDDFIIITVPVLVPCIGFDDVLSVPCFKVVGVLSIDACKGIVACSAVEVVFSVSAI